VVGSEVLTRLAAALRGDVVVSVAAPIIQTMLGLAPVNPAAPVLHAGLGSAPLSFCWYLADVLCACFLFAGQWQAKRAGLAALGFIALGMPVSLGSPGVTPSLFGFRLQESHVERVEDVRCAGIVVPG
jgi:hypothetical protein